jgi:pimeloyl-ACP methyl ester carboxylesterase
MPTAQAGEYELYYVEEGEGFPVVLIHGLAGDHTAWMPQLPRLSSKYRTIAFDNRGAGRSTQRDEPVSTEDLARDTLALMNELDVERAHIVGRSMGGAIAQHIALIEPGRVQSLVLLASFARLDPLGMRVLANMREVLEWTGSWRDHARHSVQNFVSGTFFNERQEQVAQIEALIGGESRLQACYVRQNHACLEHDTLERLGEIRCPTLVMGGGRDPICSPVATAWLGGIPGSETILFEESSHFFLLEEPERFLEALEGWLGRHTHN